MKEIFHQITDGTTRTEVRVTSDAKKNGVVLFTKK